MSKSFRKSLFGFNTDDVLNYISLSDAAAKKKLSILEKEIDSLNAKIKSLEEENCKLNEIAEEYNSQKDAINLMTENTARIYMAAKATSKLMIDNANQSRAIIEQANSARLDTISNVQSAMDGIRENISSTCKNYCDEVESLCSDLETLKNTIAENKEKSEAANISFNTLISESETV
ncbi:MAG: hypothetical protein U0M42_07165 [Acutalibacteraceae bacterium]|nr:hypothetical protein [Acutalibacteraceae bacterium]